ncbi:hypothetical protein N7456_001926 [Penicillium angulare]|uniref:t-SNARE coiled-coil homology domain-containing protein n=1 Tax=Penicillium angulare TaxID=116970 RepID=A0A9W9G8J0_9EURO|nr:hypothetical protein N7456_001926 [Penicillium angulare]
MTYQDLESLESQPTTMRRDEDPRYRDDPEFDQLAVTLAEQLESLSQSMNDMRRQISLINTKRDNPRLRERIDDLRAKSMAAFKAAGEEIKKIEKWEDINKNQRYTQNKLADQFKAHGTEFQTILRTDVDRRQASSVALRSSVEGVEQPNDDTHFQLQEQQLEQPQLANQDEVEFQTLLIEQREREIRNIEEGMTNISGLMGQVHDLVIQQGSNVDNIEQNIQDTTSDTRGANTELRSASRYQKNARNKACCLFVILAIILAIIVLAVVLG